MGVVTPLVLSLIAIMLLQLGLETAIGQELLPEAGKNQTIDEPNRNATSSEKIQELPDQPLKPLF